MLRAALEGLDENVVVTQSGEATLNGGRCDSPGQSLRHYSPMLPSAILPRGVVPTDTDADMSTTVVVHYGAAPEGECLRSFGLGGCLGEAAGRLFGVLREAESVEGASRILLPDFRTEEQVEELPEEGGLRVALVDRITRAASGEYYSK